MKDWKHMTITRELIRGGDSPVGKHSTRAERAGGEKEDQRQVGNGQSPYGEEQTRSKDDVLQR